MMNRDILTWLGSSSSLAFVLLTGQVASASPVAPQYTDYVGTTNSTTQATKTSVAQANPQYASLDPNSDTVGDLAIAKFGCDCQSCRNQVLQMLQSGSLTLPR